MKLEAIEKLTKDLRAGSATLGQSEARFLVDSYYQMQDARIRAAGQVRSVEDEPHSVLSWLQDQNQVLENQIRGALKVYAENNPVGEWMLAITGIGPVISAGFLAHIDITMAPTVGHIWRYAGQDPTCVWAPKTKRPWNAQLKVICWKAGESFVKVSSNENDIYGKVYRQRKALEIERNEAGAFADQAAAKLAKFKIGKTTEAYKHYSAGRLPDAHIHARAKRYAVKLFLSHLHGFWYENHYGAPPPLPYPIAILGHAHLM